MKRRVLCSIAVLAGCGGGFPSPEPVGCVTGVTAGLHAVTCAGLNYQISVPPQCLERACGLIVDVHGATMNAEMQEHNTGLRALGVQHGYVVVQPSAEEGFWNANPDDRKVFGLMEQVIAAFHIDTDRIHFTGFSQGGFMTWRFICAHADLFASAAPAAAGDDEGMNACDYRTTGPERPIPILFMHGVVDALVPYSSAVARRDAVIARFGLDTEALIDEGPAHRRRRYTNANGGLLEFLEHDYSTGAATGVAPVLVALKGHCFPGSTDFEATVPGQLMPFACTTPVPSAFVWGEEIMKFFLDHPRRR